MWALVHSGFDVMNLQLIVPLLLFLIVLLNRSLRPFILLKKLSHPFLNLMPNDNTFLISTNLLFLYSNTILYLHKMFTLNHF